MRAEAIDRLLPQTQCGLCGYPACRPYAEAIAAGNAPINQCPPGGVEVIAELADLLGTERLPPDFSRGCAGEPAIAVIDESACIGCALCLPACPVDAIIGARRMMHTVITAQCTGCALCLPPCPVDCISMTLTGESRDREAQRAAASGLRQRFLAHQQRQSERAREHHEKKTVVMDDEARRKRTAIARALSRARARLAGTPR